MIATSRATARPTWIHRYLRDAVGTMLYVVNGIRLFAHPGDFIIQRGTEIEDRYLPGTIYGFEDDNGSPLMLVRCQNGLHKKLKVTDVYWFFPTPDKTPDYARPVETLMALIKNPDAVVDPKQLETPSPDP